MLLSLFLLNVNFCCGYVIKTQALEPLPKFSPYYAAFSDKLKSEIREYNRLKEQLKQYKKLDWDETAKVKAFESAASD